MTPENSLLSELISSSSDSAAERIRGMPSASASIIASGSTDLGPYRTTAAGFTGATRTAIIGDLPVLTFVNTSALVVVVPMICQNSFPRIDVMAW